MIYNSKDVFITQNMTASYLLRRQTQKVLCRFLGPVFITKLMYKMAMGESLNLNDPKKFSEKICWYKLYYCPNNDLIIQCADKYSMRKFLSEIGLGEYAVKLLDSWRTVNEINWGDLPNRFAIKCSHGCGYNIICNNKNSLNIKQTKKLLEKWIQDDFGYYNGELHYNKGVRRIICEEYIDSKDRLPIDYKVHCINGNPVIVQECLDRENGHVHNTFYNMNGSLAPFEQNKKEVLSLESKFLLELEHICRTISVFFPYVRVDCYLNRGALQIGELTFTPGAGILRSLGIEGDIYMGKLWDLSKC